MDATNNILEDVIANARENHDALQTQTRQLGGMRGKMGRLAGLIPNIDQLVGRIGSRQRFESLVLAGTTAFCIAFITFYKLYGGG